MNNNPTTRVTHGPALGLYFPESWMPEPSQLRLLTVLTEAWIHMHGLVTDLTASGNAPWAKPLRDAGAVMERWSALAPDVIVTSVENIPDDILASALSGVPRVLLRDDCNPKAHGNVFVLDRQILQRATISYITATVRSLLIHLRPASLRDSQVLFDLATDPDVRKMSFTSGPIHFDDHVAWLMERIGRPDSQIWIASTSDGTLIGQIRIDVSHGEARLSLAIDAGLRGRGWGGPLLVAVERHVATRWSGPSIQRFQADIMPDNTASMRIFLNAGYERIDDGRVDNILHYRFSRPHGLTL